ncbi:DNA-primase RepB domain-containing protein [Paenibacillus aestuarii]|uniref:DNA-primase RepB domain-containing protein n=1 Tax=Paenibacillus aestuarii TaxID=516965 RepID=A0ABW0KE56_9BACL|nr:hypothetical protein [Paenibacillus aestuarii]
MNPGLSRFASQLQQSSSQAHRFIKKLRYKETDHLRFILVHDAERNKNNSDTSTDSKYAMTLYKPLRLIEKSVAQIRLNNDKRQSIHVLSQNAKGYAIFMGINQGGLKNSEINDIRAQFIDVDFNKISERFPTQALARQRLKAIQSDPAEQIQAFSITKHASGQFQLLVQRTESRIRKLKKAFIAKHWPLIKDTMIVETYSGFHIYWVIRNGAVSKFVPIQNALVNKFHSDPMITNLARVMRMPGFYHMKNPNRPFLVRVVHWGRKQSFTQNELIRALQLKP